MKLKGVYNWKLINKFTGDIEGEGEQENLITDSMVSAINESYSIGAYNRYSRIFLSSTTTPLPSAEYREYGVAASAISRDVVSGTLTNTYDNSVGLQISNNNFDPPATIQTWTIFGVDLLVYGYQRTFQSFIVLTTPVTQSTTQYLYVQYSLYAHFEGALLNGCINNYVKNYFNESLQTARFETLAYRNTRDDSWVKITPLRAPSDVNLCGRNFDFMSYIQQETGTNYGCRYGQSPYATFGVTDIPGPIGIPVWNASEVINGIFPSDDIAPSISRVFVHVPDRWTYIFSDAAYPPSSRAEISLSGTPTNKVPIICRLHITHTGDASDIVDETFTTDYVTNDQLLVSQDDWAVNDVVQLTTTGTLPSPLATSTDYYIVSKIGTSPNVYIELSLTEGGAVIELTDDGTGVHTISRQITGRYILKMEPLVSKTSSTSSQYYGLNYNQIVATEDCDGELLPRSFTSPTFLGVGIMKRYGDYIYTVQYNSDYTQLMIARQLIYTPESSQPLHSLFGTSGIVLYAVEMGKGTYADIAYIATSEGIWSYDLSSPATPTLLSITGLSATACYDIAFDEITEYLWVGHISSISRVDLGTNTATAYTSSSGPLAGISTSYLECYPGSLSAHNGYVTWYRPRGSGVWIMQDSVGYCISTSYGTIYGSVVIQKTTGYMVLCGTSGWYILSVSGITGPNTGSFTTVESAAHGYGYTSSYVGGKMLQLDNITFMQRWVDNNAYVRCLVYEVGVGQKSFQVDTNTGGRIYAYNNPNKEPRLKNGSIPIEIDEDSRGLYMSFSDRNIGGWSGGVKYGWTGSAWEKNNTTDRQIVKTGTQSLGNGILVSFNNATGEDWNDQYVQDEDFTFVISPVLVKDNLQEYTIYVRSYYCAVKRVVNWSTTCALQVRVPECPLGSSPDADFRDLDWDLRVTSVYDVTDAVYLTRTTSVPDTPADGEYSITGLLDGLFEFNANQVGHTIQLTYNYTCYW